MTGNLTPTIGVIVNLSLISHTNAGKTTLARTLLGRDVGEVRDAAHVTEVASGHVMLQNGPDTLMLWDTPGFGDTMRLLKRLKLSDNPLGWLLTQGWDRFRERPLWSSQQAVRNAREQSDVILYLVNAAEDPAGATYVLPELEILAWIGKPVVLLLNQTGPPRADNVAEEERWFTHLRLRQPSVVRGALTLDAFARCWVQEVKLLERVASLLSPEKQPAMAGLVSAWEGQNLRRFHASMALLRDEVAEALQDLEKLEKLRAQDWQAKAGTVIRGLQGQENPEADRAMQRLAERLEERAVTATEALIREHGLSGKATVEVLRRLEKGVSTVAPANAGFAAVLGGLASGALGGVGADLVAGGLTLGSGMIVGGLLGALAAGAAASGYNLVRGKDHAFVRWSDDFMQSLFRSVLLRYLAVAHFGRGRGDFEESEYPAHWGPLADEVTDSLRRRLKVVWDQGRSGEAALAAESLTVCLTECAAVLLGRLYPEAGSLLSQEK